MISLNLSMSEAALPYTPEKVILESAAISLILNQRIVLDLHIFCHCDDHCQRSSSVHFSFFLSARVHSCFSENLLRTCPRSLFRMQKSSLFPLHFALQAIRSGTSGRIYLTKREKKLRDPCYRYWCNDKLGQKIVILSLACRPSICLCILLGIVRIKPRCKSI